MTKLYGHVALGGTFDLLHSGHEKLLLTAFQVAQKVMIGITSDKLAAKLGQTLVQNQQERKRILTNFLGEKRLLKRALLVFIEDIYGPTLVDKSYQALVVSKQTLPGALAINRRRKQLSLPKLAIVIVPMVRAHDGKPISSKRIKAGEIDKLGRSYKEILFKIAGRRLSNAIRKRLKKPFGKIVKGDKKLGAKPNIITVGDVATLTFNSLKIPRKLSIVDFLTNRKKVYGSLHDLGFTFPNASVIVRNPSGQISKSLISEISKMLKSKMLGRVILVKGEEDLAAVCAIMLAPIPSTVFYGQPKKGLVMVDVDLDAKNRLSRLLKLTR